jgi:hypothetical protein
MKNLFKVILIMAILANTACTRKVVLVKTPEKGNSSTAPGLVKKQTGSQSAKEYAPGQQKKKKD